MIDFQYFNPALGGVLIGLASSAVFLFLGKIAGISGILGGTFQKPNSDTTWRYLFLFGLIAGGFFMIQWKPSAVVDSPRSLVELLIAGFLVGIGVRIGNGCTSGHGVCGIGRLSPRSVMATMTFTAAGILSVFIFKLL